MAVWHPRSPHQTECWRWYFVDRDAPTEVRHFLRDYYIHYWVRNPLAGWRHA